MSISLPFYFYLDEYNHFDFKDKVIEYFNDNYCILCNTNHVPKFHCFVERKSFISDNNFLKVIKIICIKNQGINNKTDSKLPYILTVLPGFIQPYARKTTDIIINTIDDHINNPSQTKLESAVQMGVENISSFNLYFNRVVNRIDNWTVHIMQKISELTKKIGIKRTPFEICNMRQKWNHFIKLIYKYCDALEEFKDQMLLLNKDRTIFVFALLSMSLGGLGP